jgi:hypothetical protein
MESAMDSKQKGFRRMRGMAANIGNAQRISQRNAIDLYRTMVVMNQHATQAKVSSKVRRTALFLLGALIDEEA